MLAEQRPDDAILGEEFDLTEGKNELTWVLDPIDGTRSFILGQPTWGTLAALCNETGPIWGIMDQPFTNERFIGGPNIAKMFHNGAEIPLKTRACSEISRHTSYFHHPTERKYVLSQESYLKFMILPN